MKKTVISSILALGIVCNLQGLYAKSGFFAGGELGLGFTQKSTPGMGSQYTYGADYGLHWGLKGGYIYSWEGPHAVRGYFSYGQNHLWPIVDAPDNAGNNGFKNKYGTGFLADVNVDYIFNFIKQENSSAGIFIGGFVGYAQWNGTYYRGNGQENTSLREERRGVGVGFNTGINIQIGNSSIDFLLKIPFIGPHANDAKTMNKYKSWKNGWIGFSYAWVF